MRNTGSIPAIDITNAYALEMRGTIDNIEKTQRGNADICHVDILVDRYSWQFEFYGDSIPADIDDYAKGDAVVMRFYISQRDWNGRTFTTLKGKSLRRIDSDADAGAEPAEEEADGPMPF